jgi:hypothetical protein
VDTTIRTLNRSHPLREWPRRPLRRPGGRRRRAGGSRTAGIALFFAATLGAGAAAVPIGIPTAAAQDHRDASVGLFLKEAGGRVTCARTTPPACNDPTLRTSGDFYQEYVAFLCVFNANAELGVSGLECSLRYDDARRSGVDIEAWTLCADLDWAQDGWPLESGAGNRIIWVRDTNCQRAEPGGIGTGATAIGGFLSLTAYSDDKLQIGPFKSGAGPLFKIADCAGAEHAIAPENAGYATFSEDATIPGKLPCTQRIQEKTTWGTVKDLYYEQRR